jgi:hypothetical protein
LHSKVPLPRPPLLKAISVANVAALISLGKTPLPSSSSLPPHPTYNLPDTIRCAGSQQQSLRGRAFEAVEFLSLPTLVILQYVSLRRTRELHPQLTSPKSMDGLKKFSAFCVELGKVAAALAAVVAFLAALIGIFFLFLPGKLPWTSFRIDISETEVEHNVSLADFSNRTYAKLAGNPPYKPGSTGDVIIYAMESEGFQRKIIDIRWSIYDESGQRVPEDNLNDQPGWPLPQIIFDRRPIQGVGGSGVDKTSGDIFVPLPKRDGTYFVNIEAWDKDAGIRLVSKNTEKFEVKNGESSPVEGWACNQ